MKDIRSQLLALSEESIRDFNKKLCPDAGRELLGIRIPKLRQLAKEILKGDWETFLKEGAEQYHEEIILKGLVIGGARLPAEEKLPLIRDFVPKIDSWSISDTFCPSLKIKPKDLALVWEFILPYARSDQEFDVRFAVIMMLDYYITDEYAREVLQQLDAIRHEGYYAKMAVAWTVAELGVKYNDMAMDYLRGENHLDKFTYNKALQKMRESYRIDQEQKEELKRMKRS
ncbi:MAG: DNA alkylation repair protein [Lachnospiraceae bacterium]|nr:DNA alkylation repair protein [Lachnospiraceae bacterium]